MSDNNSETNGIAPGVINPPVRGTVGVGTGTWSGGNTQGVWNPTVDDVDRFATIDGYPRTR